MRRDCSIKLHNDVAALTLKSFQINGIVQISAVAEEVRRANIEENIALEDVESLVMQAAQLVGAAIEFDSLALPGAALVVGTSIALPELPQPAPLH
ncbi:hypothetical protein [Mesorhizobium comanense]|uniref:hypothetical protein n=1 Tax=Mesorhizobium comanense TaxID=2502215 RepID=UPI0010F6AAC6|nr:hypothetical protein [Mesorhizobium comanense]